LARLSWRDLKIFSDLVVTRMPSATVVEQALRMPGSPSSSIMHRLQPAPPAPRCMRGRQVGMGAQGRDVHAGIGRGIEHRGTGRHLDLVAVDVDANGLAELAHVLGTAGLPPLDFLNRVHGRSSCFVAIAVSPAPTFVLNLL
jgi:hypothetical protein